MDPRHAERLHRYHDHELTDDERRQVEATLDDHDRQRLEAIAELGTLLRHTAEAERREAGELDVWSGIQTALAPPPGLPAAGGQVIPFGRRVRRSLNHHRAAWASMAMAAAAAALLLVVPWRGAPMASDNCTIESLEVTGAAATLLEVPDSSGQGTLTVLWLDEEELR